MSLVRIALLVGSLGIVAAGACAATSAEIDRQLAREPAEVTPANGRTVRGLLDGFRDGRLHMRLATDGGEVGYSFAPAEITRLVLPGAELEAAAMESLDRGDVATVMPLLEALGRHRIRYLPILDAARQRVLWELVAHASSASDPDSLIGILRAMTPVADTKEKRLALLEAELLVLMPTSPSTDLRDLARRWCSLADPAGRSALGWRVISRLAYDAGDDDGARWIALQPVTFSGHVAMRDLDLCYAIAIAAADRQGDVRHAHALRQEMLARHLPWPADRAFAGVGAHYTGEGDAPRIPLSATVAPAAKPKIVTIDEARKLPPPPDSP